MTNTFGTTIISLVLSAVACIAGCRLPNSEPQSQTGFSLPAAPATVITYTTASDRLNVASASTAATQFAGYGPTSAGILPNVTQSRLQIHYPHPSGRTELALAVLTVYHTADSTNWTDNFFASFTRGDSAPQPQTPQVAGGWMLDIPAWQVEAIQQKLRKENFFRRSRVLTAEAQLSVAEDGETFAKPYRAVPELDAILIRTVCEGMPVQAPSASGRPS